MNARESHSIAVCGCLLWRKEKLYSEDIVMEKMAY
jgi:hypothetical protein